MSYNKAFPKAEFEQRVADVKQRMQAAGFDLLICQDPASMGWLTGFDGWSFYTPQAVLVHLDEAAPIWFGRAQDAKSARITTDIPDGQYRRLLRAAGAASDAAPVRRTLRTGKSRAAGAARASASNSTRITTRRARIITSPAACPMRRLTTTANSSTGRDWSNPKPNSSTCAKPAASSPIR